MNEELVVERQTSVETLVHQIYQHIADQPIEEPYALLGGQMGYALFESYYHRHFGISDTSRVWERLEASIDAISAGKVDHTFAGGMSGIAWSFLHLANQGFLQDSADDPQASIAALDEPLFLLSMEDLLGGNFDYLHGGLGACLYFLERQRTPEIDTYLTQMISELEAIAVKNDKGEISWVFPNFGERKPEDPIDYNLSLSHGTASVVAILCLLHRRGYVRQQCARLIEGTLRWMWNSRNKNNVALFPNRIIDGPKDEYSRLAWCYGDLGIANTFWLAGETLRNDRWKQIARYTMLKAASRRNRIETSVADASMCHGSAGVAYLFSRFAHRYPTPIFKQTSSYWLDDTINRTVSLERKDIFLHHAQSADSGSNRPNLGLLEGEAGIGMMLLTHLGTSPAWERAFLLT